MNENRINNRGRWYVEKAANGSAYIREEGAGGSVYIAHVEIYQDAIEIAQLRNRCLSDSEYPTEIDLDDIYSWADGAHAALYSELKHRVTNEEQRVAYSILSISSNR